VGNLSPKVEETEVALDFNFE